MLAVIPLGQKKNLPEITANLMLPCSSLAIRSASSINSVPNPCRIAISLNVDEQKGGLPGAGILWGLAHEQGLLFHTHAVHARYYNLLHLLLS